MFAGAHGLKATCYLWDQWEDSLLSYTGSPIYPLILFLDCFYYVYKTLYIMYMWWINWKYNSIQFNSIHSDKIDDVDLGLLYAPFFRLNWANKALGTIR